MSSLPRPMDGVVLGGVDAEGCRIPDVRDIACGQSIQTTNLQTPSTRELFRQI